MPAKMQIDGTYGQIAYPANAETRNMIQRVIVAEQEGGCRKRPGIKREPEGQHKVVNNGKVLSPKLLRRGGLLRHRPQPAFT
jgi:hypothetical protein